jgi:hypothetical protein
MDPLEPFKAINQIPIRAIFKIDFYAELVAYCTKSDLYFIDEVSYLQKLSI